MSLYKIFEERAGDPVHDNAARRWNRRLAREARWRMRADVGAGGRRRKKAVATHARAGYAQLVAESAGYLSRGGGHGIPTFATNA